MRTMALLILLLAVIGCVTAWDRMTGLAAVVERGATQRLGPALGLAAACLILGVLTIERNTEYASGVAARHASRAAVVFARLASPLPASAHVDFLAQLVDFVIRRTS